MSFFKKTFRKKAFSLIEVMFALAITTYALLLLVALIPLGLNTTADTVQDIQASMLMEQIETDLRSKPILGEVSPYFKIQIPTNEKSVQVIYFDERSEFQGEEATEALFRAQIEMEVDDKHEGFQARLFVTSPAEVPLEQSKKVYQISTYVKTARK